MIATRYYYKDTISDFIAKDDMEIVGKLTIAYVHDINEETKKSWVSEIDTMKTVLRPYAERGSVYFEYNIPRMGRRADVIVLIDGIVFVLEFKTANQEFSREAMVQVWDYALDLKNFQEGSLDRVLLPIQVVPNEKDRNCTIESKHFEDNVYEPIQVNTQKLGEAIKHFLANVTHVPCSRQDDDLWAKSGYEPTPTIIEAAVALFEENTVEDITKHDGDIDLTAKCLERIICECREKR